MAKAELGTKRTDPDTGKKFYDLNRDPVVSPYSGKSWPLSFFEETAAAVKEVPEEEEVAEVDAENTEVELVSLEEADEAAAGDDIPDIGDDDVEIDGDDDEDDTFLAPDEDDEDDDMSDIIGVTGDDDDV